MRRWLIAILLVAAALVVQLAVPSPSTRVAPFQAIGMDGASVGDIAVEVHGVTLAEAVVVDGVQRDTSGAFVVVDVTVGIQAVSQPIASELVIGQTVYDVSARGPAPLDGTQPAAGLPVRGDLVFEVDDALLDTPAAAAMQLRVAMGSSASGDLMAQAVAVVQAPETVEQAVEVTGMAAVA